MKGLSFLKNRTQRKGKAVTIELSGWKTSFCISVEIWECNEPILMQIVLQYKNCRARPANDRDYGFAKLWMSETMVKVWSIYGFFALPLKS